MRFGWPYANPRVPWYAKALSAVVAAYALSPIDLIPDFFPIFGYLDDLLIVPLGIWAVVKLIPEPTMADLRAKALEHHKPTSKVGLAAVIVIWLAAIALNVWFFARRCERILLTSVFPITLDAQHS